jgi:hypothetical protein
MLEPVAKSNGMSTQEKLDMDLSPAPRLGLDMDESNADLVIRLCTRIGMIMEDTCVTALTIRSADATERLKQLEAFEIASKEIGALIRTARILNR